MNELNLRAHAIAGNRFVLEGGYFDFDRIVPILKTYGIEEMTERLQQHGFAIYDTSVGREQVLTRIVSDIKAQQHE